MHNYYAYRSLAALLLLGILSLSGCTDKMQQKPPTGGGAGVLQGSIYLYNKQGNQVCSFPLLNGIHAFENSTGHGCPNDNIYEWRVVSAKPRTGISFYDNNYCGHYDDQTNYSWRIVGTEDTGVTIPLDAKLSVAHDGSKGTMVYEGVYTDGSGHTGQMYGKVSCISIDHAQ